MAVNPEHFLTEDLGTRYRYDTTGYAVIKTWHFLKSSDYDDVWLEWEQQSVDGNICYAKFKITDGVTTVWSAVYSTANTAWQDSAKKVIDVSTLNNVILTLELHGKAKGRVRGIVGLLA
jgi:hypothetical protein